MEVRVASWITYFVGGSTLAGISFFALISVVIALADGNTEFILDPVVLGWLLGCVGYGYSIYLVSSLKTRAKHQRKLIWIFSIVFHALFLAFFAFLFDIGGAVFVLGVPETVIILLSATGLYLNLESEEQQ